MNVRTLTVLSTNYQLEFQKDHLGVTLRASEVKPKLDRYIFNNLDKEYGYDKGVSKADSNNWLIKNAPHPALDYKMKIIRQQSLQGQTKALIILTIKNDSLYNFINEGLFKEFLTKTKFGKGQKNKEKGVFTRLLF